MTLTTKVYLVVLICNIGFYVCYNQLLQELQIDADSNKYVYKCILWHGKERKDQYIQKVSAEYKRARKHKIQPKIQEHVFSAQTEVDMGTYKSVIEM